MRSFLLIFSYTANISLAFSAYAPPNVWDVLRSQFSLNHEIHQAAVQKQIRWIKRHPDYVENMAKNSAPYIYHIVNEIKKRKMPGELALMPMIESAYDPFAYSQAGAAGLWQLMPGTGSGLGLKQDWWFDGRRSIMLSTEAALKYLQYLNKYFKNQWILAIAAYDSGEGNVAKAIRANGHGPSNKRFWSLNLPRETKNYIPRLLAVAEVIDHPQKYNIHLPDISYEPYFEKVNIGSQIDLVRAAKLAGIPYKELIKLNPGYNRWATPPYQPYRLLIPKEKVKQFTRGLSELADTNRVSWIRHKVQTGDSLSSIADSYHTTVTLIKKINAIESEPLKMDQFILIPSNTLETDAVKYDLPKINQIDNSTTSKFQRVVHIVQTNDSYSTLAKRYHVSPAKIRYWNKLHSARTIETGKKLIIWKQTNPTTSKVYKIKPGDTLGHIAKTHYTSLKSILNLNPQIKPHLIRAGQKINLA